MSFPTEIMLLILDQLHLTPTESVETALRISSTSRYWRAAALSTPYLWSTFSISLRTRHKDFLPTFLQRSASAPLDITLSFDFFRRDYSAKAKVQNADSILRLHADRLQRLHLRFVSCPQLDSETVATFIRIKSSTLQHLEMQALQERETDRERLIDMLMDYFAKRPNWLNRCPSLTHITTTHPEFLLASRSKITHLCIKGVIERRNFMIHQDLQMALESNTNITELIVDGITLRGVGTFGNTPPLPQLRSLSLRSSSLPDGNDKSSMASLLLSITVHALSSLAVPEPNSAIPEALVRSAVTLPGITRLEIVPSTDPGWWLQYSTALPSVEELVILGADTDLHGIAGLSGDAWPNLRIIDFTEVECPSPPCLEAALRCLRSYGHRRRVLEIGHGSSRLSVRLPRRVVLGDMTPDVREVLNLLSV